MYTYIRNDSVCRASCAAVQKMLAGDVDATRAVEVFNNNYNAVKEKSPVITTFDREYQWRVSDTGSEAFSVGVNTLREICNVDMLNAPAAMDAGEVSVESFGNFHKLKEETNFNNMSYAEKRRKDRNYGRFIKSVKKNLKNG